jgi:hypothetical protein
MASRPEIRAAVAAILTPLVTTSFPYRPNYMHPEDLPASSVYLEAGDTEVDHDDSYASDSMLMIECCVAGRGDLDSQLDALDASFMALIKNNDELGGLIDGMVRSGFAYDRDPESLISSLALTFKISYEEE